MKQSLEERLRRSSSELRAQAEKIIEAKQFDYEQFSAEEISNLLHELHVHQIELELQNDELQQSEQKYQQLYRRFVQLYDFAPIGYLVIDDHHQITAANLMAAKMLGVNRATLIDHNFTDFMSSEEQDTSFSRLRALFSTGTAQHYTLKLNPAKSEVLYAKIDAHIEKNEGDNSVSCLMVMTDITDLKQTEAALQEAMTNLEHAQTQLIQQERLAAVGQLSTGVAHDFNNILTAILGHAELTILSFEQPTPIKKNLEAIIQAGNRAAHLIRQILDFSQKSIQHKKRVDLPLFLQDLIQFLGQTIPENIRISLNIEAEGLWVEADSTQLHQLFTNLAINARDAMPLGGQLTINLAQVKATDDQPIFVGDDQYLTGNWICVEVIDTGSGILTENISHIFEPFFTTKDVGKGVGLGLSQVYGIIRQHEGYITVNSRIGLGTTFIVYLPTTAMPSKKATPEDPIPSVLQGQGQKILLVEDEPSVLQITKSMLESLNYLVIPATNGQEALRAYQEHNAEIALVISDMVMPDMGGEILFRTLKASNPDLKMILLSGYPLKGKGVKLIEQDMVAWIQKPISLQQLSQVVSQAI